MFGAVLLLPCVGCASQESDQLSPQQTDQIKMEVKAVADSIWAKWEELDPEGALQYYSGSPDWMCFTSEGSRHNIQSYQKLAAEFKNSATAYKWATIRQDIVFVSTDLVICAWDGKDEASWKSGDWTTWLNGFRTDFLTSRLPTTAVLEQSVNLSYFVRPSHNWHKHWMACQTT